MAKRRHPVPDLRPQRDEILFKLISKIKEASNGCWEWAGFRNALGYGQTHWKRPWAVHRLIYACTHGPFDPKLDILHSCDNPPCCNPAHLRLGDMYDNQRERVAKGRHYLTLRTHCPRGHELSGNNVYVAPGTRKRQCRTCNRIKCRLAMGWPLELAIKLDKQKLGRRPPGVAIGNNRPPKGRGPRTHCKNGHELVGDAVYTTPAGRIECKICRRAAALRWLNDRRASSHVNGNER